MTIQNQIAPRERIFLCCPWCGSRQLSARKSITYDAYHEVEIELGRDEAPRVLTLREPELLEVEQEVTTWYVCSSPDCVESRDMQLEELVAHPRPFDLCQRCGHHFEDHAGPPPMWSAAEAPATDDDLPCRYCGCADFVVRVPMDDQPELPGVTVEGVRETGHDGESVTAMAGGAA